MTEPADWSGAADALRSSEPALYAAILQRGAEQERARVVAHLDLGKSCHAEEQALQAIRSGSEMTSERTTAYLTAAMNHADRYARQRESAQVDAALAGLGIAAGDGDLGDHIVAKLRAAKSNSNPFVRS